MLATSPKKTSAAGKKREREPEPVAVPTAAEGVPKKKRRKDGGKKRRDDGGEQRWAWTALAESSVSALAPLFTPDSRCVQFIPISADIEIMSRYFFTTAASSLQIFSTATGKLVSTIPAHTDTITALLLNPHDSTQLFSASLDGTLKRWDTHHGALLETLRIDQPVTHIAAHVSLVDELFVVTSAKSGSSPCFHFCHSCA
jgi:NET1-associated nuclear protein 1 (U3 small nucleolar RNA-associated protein 17)